MVDRWRFRVSSDQEGLPSAIIDVEIARRIVVPLSEAKESLNSAFGELGWTFASDALKFADGIDPSQRQFIAMDWQEAPGGQFPNRPFAKILEVLDSHITWRVEGSAEAGFWGVLSSAGVEVRFDLSEEKIQPFIKYVIAKKEEIVADILTPEQHRKIDTALCEVMHQSALDTFGCILRFQQEREERDAEQKRNLQKKNKKIEDGIRGGLHDEKIHGGGATGSIDRIGGPYRREPG